MRMGRRRRGEQAWRSGRRRRRRGLEAEAGRGQKGELPDQVAEQVVGAGPKALPQPHCHLDEETAAPGSQRRGTLHLCLLKAGHACTPRGPPQNTGTPAPPPQTRQSRRPASSLKDPSYSFCPECVFMKKGAFLV